MRITESQLRRVIRDVIRESYEDGNPGDIASHEYYPDMGIKQSDAPLIDHNLEDTVAQSQEALEALGRPEVPLSVELKNQVADLLAALQNLTGMGKPRNIRN